MSSALYLKSHGSSDHGERRGVRRMRAKRRREGPSAEAGHREFSDVVPLAFSGAKQAPRSCVHWMAHGGPPGKRGGKTGENMVGSQRTGLDPGWLLGCMTPYIDDVSAPQFPHPPKRGWRALTEAEGKASRRARQLLTARRA